MHYTITRIMIVVTTVSEYQHVLTDPEMRDYLASPLSRS